LPGVAPIQSLEVGGPGFPWWEFAYADRNATARFENRQELVDGVSRWSYSSTSAIDLRLRGSIELFGNLAAIEVASKRSRQ